VGRGEELARLAQLQAATLGSTRRAVFVTGEAGIGKTALVQAFLGSLQPGETWIAAGQCIEQYGPGAPYLPVFEGLGRLARGANERAVRDTLRQIAPHWLAQLPELQAAGGSVTRGAATPERLLRELADALPALSQLRPLVWWIEDLHWADYSTLDLISCVARRSDPARLLVIGTYRSVEVDPKDPLRTLQQSLQQHGQCEELALRRLSTGDVLDYLGARFAPHVFPDSMAQLVRERSSGNPLFMEQLVDMLVERGVLERQGGPWRLAGDLLALSEGVPSNISAMLERELERLSAPERALLEAASVVGVEFSTALLSALLADDLEQIEQRCSEWARRGRFVRVLEQRAPADLRCQFIHALFHEVIYQSIGPARRARLHQTLGEQLERSSAQPPAVLAMHFSRAGDLPRSLRYHRDAGERALRQGAPREAIAHFSAALLQTESLAEPERQQLELELDLALGVPLAMTLGYAAPEVERVYRRAAQLCAELGEPTYSFPVISALAQFSLMRARYHEALTLGEQFLALALRQRDRDAELEANFVLGAAYWYLGPCASSRFHLQEVLRLYGRPERGVRRFVYQQDAYVAASSYLAWLLWLDEQPDSALVLAQESLRFARKIADPFSVATACFFVGYIHRWRGEAAQALAQAEALMTLAGEQGFLFLVSAGTELKGAALIARGEVERGLNLLQRGWEAHQATGAELGRTYWQTVHAEACLSSGLFAEAGSVLAAALQAVRDTGEHTWEAVLYMLYAELARRAPDCAPLLSPLAATQQALVAARRMGAKAFESRAVAALARLGDGELPRDGALRLDG